jgi:hypothetical protein
MDEKIERIETRGETLANRSREWLGGDGDEDCSFWAIVAGSDLLSLVK